jgi:hypothetical protein
MTAHIKKEIYNTDVQGQQKLENFLSCMYLHIPIQVTKMATDL